MSPANIPARRLLPGFIYSDTSGTAETKTGRDWRDQIEREGLTLKRDPDGAIVGYKGAVRRLEIYLEG